jgi:ABC-2 type transport system permease protein
MRLILMKELKSYFKSPLAYILAGLFSAIIGWLFFNYLVIAKNYQSESIITTIVQPLFGNINFVLLFLTPLITMRLFAEEKKQRSLELLLCAPVSNIEIILGKYFAAVGVTLFMLGLTVILPYMLSVMGFDNWPLIGASYLGTVLTVMCYVSIGLFASSLTDNQVVAAVISFFLLFFFMLLVISANATQNPLVGQIFQYMSVAFHFEGFVRGVVKNYNLVFYGSFIFFTLFLTEKSLDSRNW